MIHFYFIASWCNKTPRFRQLNWRLNWIPQEVNRGSWDLPASLRQLLVWHRTNIWAPQSYQMYFSLIASWWEILFWLHSGTADTKSHAKSSEKSRNATYISWTWPLKKKHPQWSKNLHKAMKRQVLYRTEMVCDGIVYPFPVWFVKSTVLML